MQVTVVAVFLVCHSIRAVVSLAELIITLLGFEFIFVKPESKAPTENQQSP